MTDILETTRPEVFVDTFTLSLCHLQVEISAPEIHLKWWQFLPLPVLNASEHVKRYVLVN